MNFFTLLEMLSSCRYIYEGSVPTVSLLMSLFEFIGVLGLHSFDAWSLEIISQRTRILVLSLWVTSCFIFGLTFSLTPTLSKGPFGSDKIISFFGQSWKINNIYATSWMNEGYYSIGLLLQMVLYPGHYSMLKSLVKQRSYERC